MQGMLDVGKARVTRTGRVAIAAVIALLALPAAAQARAFPKDFQWGWRSPVPGRGRAGNEPERQLGLVWTHDADNIAGGVVTDDRPEDGPGFWTRHKRDVRLAGRDLNQKAFLTASIEWSRVFPTSTAGVSGMRALDEIADQGRSGAAAGSCARSAPRG